MQTLEKLHPKELKIFFLTEMWERYGFYTVQTLLTLYLVMAFKWEDQNVYPLVGTFTALTYLTPVLGGWIGDKFLGQKRSVFIGAFLLFLSYIALGYITNEYQLNICLAGIAVGTGLLKPNISSLLGKIYPIGAPGRERGFTIFYMGITAGIVLGTTLPSYIKNHFGWHASFSSASIGLIFAMFIFAYGVNRFGIKDYKEYVHNLNNIALAWIILFAMWLGCFLILHNPQVGENLFIIISAFSIGYLVSTIAREDKEQSKKTLVILVLCLMSVVFWAFYFQMFLSITLLLKRVANPTLFGMNFPPPYYVAVQSIGMIIFGVLLGLQKKRSKNIASQSISAGNKFLLATIFLTLSYALITVVCYSSTDNLLLSPLYFIPAFMMISVAELLLSPAGLSTVTLLSNNKKVSTMTGIFFVSLGIGGFLSGKIAELTSVSEHIDFPLSTGELKFHYGLTFNHLLNILIFAVIICILLNYVIKYLMRTKPSSKNYQ